MTPFWPYSIPELSLLASSFWKKWGAAQELQHWLFGNILGLSNLDLWMSFVVGIIAVSVLTLFNRSILLTLFEPQVAKSLGVNTKALNYGAVCPPDSRSGNHPASGGMCAGHRAHRDTGGHGAEFYQLDFPSLPREWPPRCRLLGRRPSS